MSSTTRSSESRHIGAPPPGGPRDHGITSVLVTRRSFLAGSVAAGTGVELRAPAAAAPGFQPATQEADRETWQIGCYTRPWAQYDYRVALDAVLEAGFKYVGLMTTKSATRLVISVATTPEEAAKVAEEVRERGLRVVSVYGGDIPVEKSLEAGIQGLRRLIDHCATVGSGNLLMGGVGDPKLYDPYYKAIAECCDYAAEKRVGMSLKPHGGLNATGPQCRKTIEQVGHRNFRIWYDPGNIYYYSDGKLDPVEQAGTVDGLVNGMCVKDFLPPKEVLITPGTGKVDFPGVLNRLKEGGFVRGPLVVETLAQGDLPGVLVEAKKAQALVEGLTAGRPALEAGRVPGR